MKTNHAVSALKARPFAAFATLFALAIVSHALLVGCGGSSSNQETNAQTSSTTETPAETPPAATSGTPDGAQIYAQRCVLCHGASGMGDGPGAAGLNPKPRNHTDGSYMNAQTDEALIEVIKNGKGAMPAWGTTLSDAEVQAVLKHVRSLAQPPYPG